MYKINTSKELVREIAAENPTQVIGNLNSCRYCEKSWTEVEFSKWIENEQKVSQDPEAEFENPPKTKIRWNHHDSDCLWVRANQTVRRDL